MIKDNLRKNFIWNTLGTAVYTFNSLFFMILVTRINGIDQAGIFTFAFSFACMMQVIGTYAGRTYHVTDIDKDCSDINYIYQRLITCFIMLLTGIGFVIIKGYTCYKILIILFLLIYRILDAFSETIYAIFQKNNELYKVGISLLLKSLIGLITFFIINVLTNKLILSIISLIIVNFIVLIVYDYKNFKKYKIKKDKINIKYIKKLFIGGFSVFLFTFLTQYVINATKYAIDDLLIEQYQTIFGIILMPATLMALCSQLIIQPFLTNIKQKLIDNDYLGFRKITLKICLSILLLGIFVEFICYILGIPFLNLLYSINLNQYLYPFLIIIAGSILFSIVSILSNCLIALRKNKIQTLIYIIASIFSTIISYILINRFEILGASLSYLLTMLLIFILYLVTFIKATKTPNN